MARLARAGILLSTSRCGAVPREWRNERAKQMSIIGWIIIGALAGWIASMIMGTNARMGWLANIIVGILGAIVGGFIYALITGADWAAGFNLGTLIVAIIGAIILLAIYRAVAGGARA